jgi:hypothetical protein
MKIHYSRRTINMMMLLGALGIISGLGFLLLHSPLGLQFPLGLLLIMIAMNARIHPYCVIEEDKIVVPFLGPLKQTISFGSQANLLLEGNYLYVLKNGRHIRTRIARGMTDPGDWAALEALYGRK